MDRQPLNPKFYIVSDETSGTLHLRTTHELIRSLDCFHTAVSRQAGEQAGGPARSSNNFRGDAIAAVRATLSMPSAMTALKRPSSASFPTVSPVYLRPQMSKFGTWSGRLMRASR